MADQSLDNDEQLNVRWAYEDPNPRAQAAKLRNHAVQMLAAMNAKGHLDSIDDTHEDACAAPCSRDCNPTQRRLQPHAAVEAATPRNRGCSPMQQRLQPCVVGTCTSGSPPPISLLSANESSTTWAATLCSELDGFDRMSSSFLRELDSG